MKQSKVWQEEERELYVRRIKETEETTDQTVLRSDKLLWELRKERTEERLSMWREGKPTVECGPQFARFMRAMGIGFYGFPGSADQIPVTERYPKYKATLERLGYPEASCEHSVVPLAQCELGELTKPDAQLVPGHACDVKKYQRQIQAILLNIPMFYLDIPLNEDDKPNLAELNYVAGQLGEFIEWAEKTMPGVKYDESRHIELMETDIIGERYQREIYQLIKHVPCPIGPLDDSRMAVMRHDFCSEFPNRQKALEYLRMLRDELGERVASGTGPYPEERLRLLFSGEVPHRSVLNIGKVLLERKIAMPFSVGGPMSKIHLRCRPIGEMSEYGIKLSPLQEEARTRAIYMWGGSGKRWVNATLDIARDLGAQGIVNYLAIGCTPMRSTGSMVAERAEKELRIPTLNMEGRLYDTTYMSQAQFDEKLSSFIDKCFDWAGKSRK